MADDPLLSRFRELWQRLGADDVALDDTGRGIVAAYEGPGRAYHSRRHLEDVLEKLDWGRTALGASGDLKDIAQGERVRLFDTVELALWYHDVVYDPTQKDNEARSRDKFLADAARYNLRQDLRADIAKLIDITASHRKAATLSEKIMCDCDLAILGAPQEEFSKYDANIRKEYAHVPEATYQAARRHVLGGFLKDKSLFKTKAFQDRFDAQARANLSGAVKPLVKWLKSLFRGPKSP